MLLLSLMKYGRGGEGGGGGGGGGVHMEGM